MKPEKRIEKNYHGSAALAGIYRQSNEHGTNLSEVVVVQRHLGLGVDVFQVPPEGLALEVLPQVSSSRQVSDFNVPGS